MRPRPLLSRYARRTAAVPVSAPVSDSVPAPATNETETAAEAIIAAPSEAASLLPPSEAASLSQGEPASLSQSEPASLPQGEPASPLPVYVESRPPVSAVPLDVVTGDAVVLGDGIAISARTTELPVSTGTLPPHVDEVPAREPQAVVSTAAGDAAEVVPPSSLEAALAVAAPDAPVATPGSSGQTDVETRPASHAETTHESAATAHDESARRVESSEVPQRDPAETAWTRELVRVAGDVRTTRAFERDETTGKRIPFWKRIALPRSPSEQASARVESLRATTVEPLLARLAELEQQLAANQSATETQLRRFEENLTRLWEVEEQMALTEVRERLALLEANQQEVADGLHNVGRNLILIAVVLASGVAAGLLVVGLLL